MIRTASSELRPNSFRKDAGSNSDLPERYRPPPYNGKSSAGLPNAVHWATSPYVPSSGPRELGVFGSTKNATTLTTNEAKIIAYNLLFKVVNFTLKSFMVALTVNRS